MNNKKLILLFTGVVTALLLIVFFIMDWNKSPKGQNKNSKNNKVMSKNSDPTLGGGSNGSKSKDPFGGPPGFGDDGVTPAFLLQQYQEWAKYPPNSRPIDNNNHDLIRPYEIDLDAVTMFDTPTSKKPNGYRCHFQPKTWAIVGMENDIVITLECRDSSNKAIPIRIDNHAMYHYKEWDGTKTQAHNADYTDNGTGADLMANDNIYTFTWRPMSNHWGQMFLEVDITYSPEDKKAHIVAAFFSSPRKPAEFTNYFREVIEDGSLVIYAGISVYTSGSYNIQANLKDVNGNYIAYATEDVKLSTGSQEVRLLFYGKILRDAEARSPYTLTSLRGYRENLPFDPELFGDPSPKALKIIQSAKTTEPDKEIIPIFKEEHKTKEYSLDEFSDKEWQSPEKDRRIQELKSIEPTSPPEIKSE